MRRRCAGSGAPAHRRATAAADTGGAQRRAAAGLQPLAAHLGDREQLRQSGLLKVVDPDTAISMIRNFTDNVPITHFYSWTLPPGLPLRWAQAHLELFASEVIPA